MKKVYVRFYDQNNLGDDLFVHILSERYSDDLVFRKGYHFGSYMPNRVKVHREHALTSIIDKVLSRVLKTRFALSLPAIKKADLLVYIGGSLFMDTAPLSYWDREIKFYQSVKIPYYIIGSNVGPIRSNEFIETISNIFKNAQDVCFRDSNSYELFKDMPTTRVATDIAFSLNTQRLKSEVSEREKVAVFSIIDTSKKFDAQTARKYEEEVINLSQRLAVDGYRITYMSFCKDEGDEVANNRVLAGLSIVRPHLVMTPFRLKKTFSRQIGVKG